MTNDISRRTLLRTAGVGALAVPAGFILAGCGSDADDAGADTTGAATGDTSPDDTSSGDGDSGEDLLSVAKDQGYIRVAIANEPPYTKVTADGEVTGVEPDVCRAVCKLLGIDDIQGIITTYDGMIPGLKVGRWDAITAGLFMKESRCAEVEYSQPVIVSTESFAVPPGNPKGIKTVQDVIDNPDLKIIVLPGAFEEGILQEADVPDDQLVRINDNRSGVKAVISGRADAFLLPTLSLKSLAETEEGFDVTDPIEDAPKTGSGAAFRKSDADFVKKYNEQLDEFKKTDEFAKILKEWDFDPEAAQGVTAEELCKNPG